MMSKLNFTVYVKSVECQSRSLNIQTCHFSAFSDVFEEPFTPRMNIKAHGKCTGARICVSFLIHRIKPGQLGMRFSGENPVRKKRMPCIIYMTACLSNSIAEA